MSNNKRFKKLLEPGQIGAVRTKMRLIKTGANPGFFEYEDGNVPQQIIDYYEALAAGGVGLVTVGAGEIDWPIGTVPDVGYRMDEDRYIPSLKKLADAIHKHDCPAFIQLFHMGPLHPEILSGVQPIAASSLPKEEMPRPDFFVAREMTLEDIERVKEKFVTAAIRAHKAGFEGVELNAACNHLLNSFMSRAWNKRQDGYGYASMESRARIVVEIIEEIKKRVGQDFAIIALLNGVEPGLEDGITIEEAKEFAKIFEKAGADAIHARAEFYTKPKDIQKRDSTHFPDIAMYPTRHYPLGKEIDGSHHGIGAWVPQAAEIKKVVSIPVITIGRLDPTLGEKILREGKADFISHNRRLMADHDLPRKLIEGRMEDIAPCTACMTCFDRVENLQSPRCRINTALGREKEYEIKPADKKKNVMIVGGGPAGMEAARVAALRGHKVSLYEKMGKLGGSMLVAATVKGLEKEDLISLIKYLETQVTKLGVEVKLGEKVTESTIERVKPDVLILAAGAIHDIPEIPGIKSRKVVTSEQLHNRLKFALKFAGPRLLRWLTKFYMPVGKNIVVLGARLHGCQTAEFLIKRGRNVTIIDTCKEEEIGDGLLVTFMKPWLLLWLDEKGVSIFPEVKYEEITNEGIVVTTKDGNRQTLEADTIITAMPLKPDIALLDRMKSKVSEVYAIGDTRDPGYIVDAVEDGSRISREI